MVKCSGCDLECDSNLCCPKCMRLDRHVYFCTQECFESSWLSHNMTHNVNRELEDEEKYKNKLVQRMDGNKGQLMTETHTTELYTVDNSINNFKTLRLYDLENNNNTVDGNNISKWLMESAMKLSKTLDMTEDLHDPKLMIDGKYFKNRYNLDMKNINNYKLKKSTRRFIVIIFFIMILGIAYTFSIRMVNIMEERYTVKLEDIKNDDKFNELNNIIEELRIEVKNLKEIIYNNAMAINGLTNGSYKVPGDTLITDSSKKINSANQTTISIIKIIVISSIISLIMIMIITIIVILYLIP